MSKLDYLSRRFTRKIKVTEGDKEYVIDIPNEIKVDLDNINEVLASHPQVFYYINTLANQADMDYRMAIKERERTMASIFVSEKLSKDTSFYKNHFKSPSDDYASNAAIKSLKYQAALKREILALKIYNDLKALVAAFNQRARNLEQLSNNIRRENSNL